MRSLLTTYPPSGSSSWRSAPFISTGWPLTSSWPFFISTLRKPTFTGITSVSFPLVNVARRVYRLGVSAVHFCGAVMSNVFTTFPLAFLITSEATVLPAASMRSSVSSPEPFTLAVTVRRPSV